MTDQKSCGHPKEDGEPCATTFGLCDDCGQCFAHCEHREEARRAARQKGADRANRPKGSLSPGEVPARPESMEDALLWASWGAWAVATGELDTARGNTVARLVKEYRIGKERLEVKAELKRIRRQMEADGDAPELEALP